MLELMELVFLIMVVIMVLIAFMFFIVKAKEIFLELHIKNVIANKKTQVLSKAKDVLDDMDEPDLYVLYGTHCLHAAHTKAKEEAFIPDLDEDHTDIFLTLNALKHSHLSIKFMANCYVEFLKHEKLPAHKIQKEYDPDDLLLHIMKSYAVEGVNVINADDEEDIQRHFENLKE